MANKTDQEDWRLCAEWLVRCNILANEHHVNNPSAEVFELAQILRDGVLLCHLLNRLSPGVIDVKEFSQRPQMSQFLCIKNIRIFLTKCTQNFSIKHADLFDPIDLFEVKDFGKVISVLSKLSKSQAKKLGIDGFSADEHQKVVKEREKIYAELPKLADEQEPSEELYDCVRNEFEKEDEIYEDLMSIRKRSSAIVPPVSQTRTRRDHCISELVETERNYVDVLNMLLQHFVQPLTNVLSQNDHDAIFKGIESLHRTHTSFHSELSKACSSNDRQSDIPDCFIKWKDSFLIYGEYCSNLPVAQEKVDELAKKSPEVQQSVMDCQMRANEGRFRLRDLLSVPMQRVLKYHLLLKELIKNTEKTARDRPALQRALEEMQDLSLYVNEVKRDNEALQLILDIQNSIVDLQMPEHTALKDYGRLLKDGELKIKKHPDNKTKSRYIFLFDKVMLMCRSRGETYNYKDALILSQFKIDSSQKDKEKGFSFMLVDKQGAVAYTLYTKTSDIRTKWKEAISMAHDNTAPHGARVGEHDFIMHSFETPTICDVCRKLLRGVFYQGYKCQLTNTAVHKECISKAEKVKGPPQPPPRLTHQSSSNRLSSRPALLKCKAKFTHQGNMGPPGESRPLLQFNCDDVIEVLDNTNANWWEGRIKGGKEGIFPPNYVEVLKSQAPRANYEPAQSHLRPGSAHIACPPSPSPSANGHLLANNNSAGYINLQDIADYPWYMDQMERDHASAVLVSYRDGTYLVRKSTNAKRPGAYALSIKYGTGNHCVKHIRIEQSADQKYFIADCKMFISIPELVTYYSENSLQPSFPDLNTTLIYPFKKASDANIIGWCVANFDYAANQPNQLSLEKGDRIAIINKAGDSRGWWKGQIHDRVGYFPSAYVVEED